MGDARRRKLAGGPRFQPKPEATSSLSRTPEELQAENENRDRFYATAGAAVDFINQVSDDVESKQIGSRLKA